jgi:hypothetical protein
VSAPGQVATLLTMLGGQAGDNVPGLLTAYHDQHGGQINEPLRGPPVAATFSKLAQLTPASQDRRYLSPCGTAVEVAARATNCGYSLGLRTRPG